MRKVAAAALAVPVYAILYLPLLAKRSIAARFALVATVGVMISLAALGLAQPIPTGATPPAPSITALPAAAFRAISVGIDLRAGIPIDFSEAMDPVSVAASLSLEPSGDVTLDWSGDHRTVTVHPATHWPAGSYQVITVQAGALAASGRPMANAARAAFVTRETTSGRIEATQLVDGLASINSTFRLTFDHPVATADVESALRITPPVDGTLEAEAQPPDAGAADGPSFVFTPASPLAAGITYKVTLDGLVDGDGAPVTTTALSVSTTHQPTIVRVRPRNGTPTFDPSGAVSVRFSTAMDPTSTKAAFSLRASRRPVAGSIRFAEGGSVLIFDPAKALPANTDVFLAIAATAESKQGVAIGHVTKVKFHTKTIARARPRAVAHTTTRRSTRPSGSSGSSGSGGAVGGGSWGAVETYYLRLMNCTRTGGWVTSTGSCSSPGGRNVAALKLDSGISSRVSRPYAKRLAVGNLCSHFVGGNPGDRLRAAGYTSYNWAENIGCRSGNPYSAVLASHLFFQSEKSTNGGHYVNLMNAAYNRCGIGVWVYSGRVRLVIDFYHS